VFDDPGIVRIRNAGRPEARGNLHRCRLRAELARVLAYDLHKREARPAAQAACIAQCRRLSHRIDTTLPEPQRAGLPAAATPTTRSSWRPRFAAHADLSSRRTGPLLYFARRGALAAFRIVTPQAFGR